jgi:UDP-N-acetylglucosamine:LPS N-acetylglucosamine transferase
MQQRDMSEQKLASLLQSWLGSREALLERARKARTLAQPNALSRITGVCLEAAGVTP